MKQLQDRVAIVTGASKGIGKAIARAFAMEGASVMIAARDRPALDAVTSEIARDGGAVLAIPTDITLEADVVALFKAAVDRHGRLDILVNNAGITLGMWRSTIVMRVITSSFSVAIREMRSRPVRFLRAKCWGIAGRP